MIKLRAVNRVSFWRQILLSPLSLAILATGQLPARTEIDISPGSGQVQGSSDTKVTFCNRSSRSITIDFTYFNSDANRRVEAREFIKANDCDSRIWSNRHE